MVENIDVVIIGAGHIGLSISFFLKKAGISHVVLEKNEIASTWSTQRWDSFNLVLPNWSLKLPEFSYQGSDPDGFLDLAATIQYIQDFARQFQLPVRTGVEVLELIGDGHNFLLRTGQGKIKSRCVVVATGAYRNPQIPKLAAAMPTCIQQMHSSDYRNPKQITAGSVLVVGTGQSGTQIADELHSFGQKVFLSVSRCGGRPRRYRGKDCVWWMQQMGYYDQKPSAETFSKKIGACNVPLTGQNGGVDINLNDLRQKGVELLGRIVSVEQDQLKLLDDLNINLQYADREWHRFLTECDFFANQNDLSFPLEPSAYEFTKFLSQPEKNTIHFIQEDIKTIIWATGFTPTYPWISLPIFNVEDYVIHNQGITRHNGLYFVGLPWQRKRSSSIFLGSTDDAEFISQQVINHLITG